MTREADFIEEQGRVVLLGWAHGLYGRERETTDEDREAAEEDLLMSGEQLIAPADSVPQGSQASGLIPRSAGQDGQSPVEPGQERRRRQMRDARGGQLDREGQAIEPGADTHDDRRVVRGEGEAGLPCLSS